MTRDEIAAEWQRDTQIDMTELGAESVKTTKLHSKYLTQLINAQNEEREARKALNKMTLLKTEYYLGNLDKKTLDYHGLAPFLKKVMKPDVYMWLEADANIQMCQDDLTVSTQKVKLLEEIIKSLNGRGYLVKNGIDWERFKNGG